MEYSMAGAGEDTYGAENHSGNMKQPIPRPDASVKTSNAERSHQGGGYHGYAIMGTYTIPPPLEVRFYGLSKFD